MKLIHTERTTGSGKHILLLNGQPWGWFETSTECRRAEQLMHMAENVRIVCEGDMKLERHDTVCRLREMILAYTGIDTSCVTAPLPNTEGAE